MAGTSNDDDHDGRARRRARADARPLSRRGGLRRARRRARVLRGLRQRRSDRAAAADLVDHPLAALEGADPLPRAARARGDVRRARQRALGPADTLAAYAEREFAADALAVLDATATERAVLVGLSAGVLWGMLLAAEHPERVAGAAFIAPAAPFATHLRRATRPFDEPLESYEGWDKYNRHFWLAHYREFLEFFFDRVFTEPHSTKQKEDCVGWGLETTPRRSRSPISAASSTTPASSPASASACSVRCW